MPLIYKQPDPMLVWPQGFLITMIVVQWVVLIRWQPEREVAPKFAPGGE